MTTATMTAIPMAIGSALFSTIGRGLLWAIVTTVRAPVTTGLLVCMTLGTAYAATNALYLQTGSHPAPLFADPATVTASVPAKSEPKRTQPAVVTQPAATPAATAPKVVNTPAVTAPAPVPAVPEAVAEIDNSDVKVLQEKLTTLGYYEGEADGFYGPKTAAAIRAFEHKAGMTPVGALTPEVLKAVAAAKPGGDQAAAVKAPAQPAATATAAPQRPEASLTLARSNAGETRLTVTSPTTQTTQKLPQVIKTDPLAEIAHKVADTAQKALSARPVATDRSYVEKVQRGLASLGFLRGKIDGVAGEDTAKAIRNFEVYYNYKVTGDVTPELVDLLEQAGAQI